jgi:6-phosphogluconolactonase
MPSENVIKADSQAVAEAVAKATVDVLSIVLKVQETAVWMFTGGTLPPTIFQILARDYRDALDWSKIIFGVSDERCVPFDNPDSNWLLAEQGLLGPLGEIVPEAHKLRPAADQGAETAATAYEQTLASLQKNDAGLPRYDLMWIGFGDDGHTLSLFPNHPSFEPSEQLVIPVHNSPKPPADRISLTVKAMAGSVHCFVIGAGANKAPAAARAQNGDTSLPLQQVTAATSNAGGDVTWFLDVAAAEQL